MRKKQLLVANWKATKTIKETVEWIKSLKTFLEEVVFAKIIVCPPFTSLPFTASLFQDTNIKVGAQDVSKFEKGAFTGEVTVEMLDGLVNYCIVGHSERRKYFGETNADVIKKLGLLIKYRITPILCLSDLKQLDSYITQDREIFKHPEKIIFVYEPPSAISGGGAYHPEDPKEVNYLAGKIGEKLKRKATTLYGGSLNPENVSAFFSQPNIDGGLIGQASSNPQVFRDLIDSIRLSNLPSWR